MKPELSPAQLVGAFIFINVYLALPWYAITGAARWPPAAAAASSTPWWLPVQPAAPMHPALSPLAVSLCIIGSGIMLSADAQKTFTLEHRQGLITSGLFSHVRNPNYTGELLIYMSFATLGRHVVPWAVVMLFALGVWVPGMARKEKSLSRHQGHAWYQRNTWLWIPGLW
jgi:protein-S-isoprenylcysteine O-methyltransferase Ste14